MIELTLSILVLLLIILGVVEAHFHKHALAQLPVRIHVNGSRGKSSVTRLIAAGLRAGGLKTLAKTTGTAPRIIDHNGEDRVIHRLRSASIGEQVRLLRHFAIQEPDAIVIECMAVQPQYQWIAEHKMINSTIGVITNVRPDHLDEMGLTIKDNALSLSNTIPFNKTLVTIEGDLNRDEKFDYIDRQIDEVLVDIAKKRNTKLYHAKRNNIPSGYMDRFPYIEHSDNVAIALKVCELNGVKKNIALEGMVNALPDPGASVVWNLKISDSCSTFINAFAANDPTSTFEIWNQLQNKIKDSPVCIFLNTRDDRHYRTNQLLHLIFTKIKPDHLIVRGENLPPQYIDYKKTVKGLEIVEFSYKSKFSEYKDEFSKLNNYFIIGIGNMVGWGEDFINNLKKYKL